MFDRMQLWLLAIRDGFITLLPLTFFGVAAVLAKHLPLPAYQSTMVSLFGDDWFFYLDNIISATHGVFGVALAVVVSSKLAYRLNLLSDNGARLPLVMVSVSTLINFMLCMVDVRSPSMANWGLTSIFPSIAIGIASAEILRVLANIRLLNVLRMPYQTDPTVFISIRISIPMIVTGLIFLVLARLRTEFPPLTAEVFDPLIDWAQASGEGAWWLNTLATFINQTLWYLGIHGGNMLDAYAKGFFPASGMPYSSDLGWRPLIDSFVFLGGSGATLSLLLAIGFVVKEGSQRRIAQLSAPMAIFNINESVLYGLPVVLNPLYLLPFIGVPIVLILLSVGAVEFGFFQLQAVAIPWTTPVFVSGWLLTGSWQGALFQLVELIIGTALYLPFVKRAEKQRLQQQTDALKQAANVILNNSRQSPVLSRQDQVGIIGRGLLDDLRRDLRKDALALAYQPKHDRGGKIIGVEALMRWSNPHQGTITPAVGVTLAEESGDIHHLGMWVLDQACACKARWNAMGYTDLTVAVNVSPLQLTNAHLPKRLEENLQRYHLRPEEIELEITESQMIQDIPSVNKTLQLLCDMGVHLAMDDFGMGYSSLLHLRRFQVKAIKIDGSLTRDVLTSTANADIIRSIVALGQARNVDIVAEYVETLDQREALMEMGCNIFQGYYHSKPLYEDKCPEYFRQNLAAYSKANE